jgi:hypothetical protein
MARSRDAHLHRSEQLDRRPACSDYRGEAVRGPHHARTAARVIRSSRPLGGTRVFDPAASSRRWTCPRGRERSTTSCVSPRACFAAAHGGAQRVGCQPGQPLGLLRPVLGLDLDARADCIWARAHPSAVLRAQRFAAAGTLTPFVEVLVGGPLMQPGRGPYEFLPAPFSSHGTCPYGPVACSGSRFFTCQGQCWSTDGDGAEAALLAREHEATRLDLGCWVCRGSVWTRGRSALGSVMVSKRS